MAAVSRDATVAAKPSVGSAHVALLGRLDMPTDGVRDYCQHLSEAFARCGEVLEIAEVRWESQGWLEGIGRLWRESRKWRRRWMLFQYTALMWSRRGFPVGAIAVLWILKMRGAKICVVFHDIRYDRARGWKQRVRVAFQYRTMRLALRWATRGVLTVPAEQVPWLPKNSAKSAFIPVGANLPKTGEQAPNRPTRRSGVATIAVFGITEGPQGQREAAAISYLIKKVIAKTPELRVLVMGRGSTEAEDALRGALEGSGVQVSVLGLLAAEKVRQNLAQADVLLCIRGHISSRRGSAIAGIACGLPIVGYRGEETAFPITEAGVLLAENGDRDGVADALCRVLTDDKLREELRRRSAAAEQQYFSWDAIAAQFLRVLAGR